MSSCRCRETPSGSTRVAVRCSQSLAASFVPPCPRASETCTAVSITSGARLMSFSRVSWTCGPRITTATAIAAHPPEVTTHLPVSIPGHDGFESFAPSIGRMDVAITRGITLQITELVETKERVVAGPAEVSVVGRSFLVAVSLADAAVPVENDLRRRVPVMHTLDTLPGKIGKRGEILLGGQNFRLELPWNSSFRQRSNSTRRHPCFNSPIGYVMV